MRWMDSLASSKSRCDVQHNFGDSRAWVSWSGRPRRTRCFAMFAFRAEGGVAEGNGRGGQGRVLRSTVHLQYITRSSAF